jgi:putative transposase
VCELISMRRAPPSAGRRSSPGARPNYKDPAGEPADHALGRSRGGWTTKIHTLTDQYTCPVTVILTPGQAGDNPQLVPLLQAHGTRG